MGVIAPDPRTAAVALVMWLLAVFAIVYTGGGTGGIPTESLDQIRNASRRILDGKRPESPSGAMPEVARVFESLDQVYEGYTELSERGGPNTEDIEHAATSVMSAVRSLTDGVANQMNAAEESSRHLKEMSNLLRELGQNVEVLAANAEESSSSVLEMTATNETVAENIVRARRERPRDRRQHRGDGVLDQRGRQERRRALAHGRRDQLEHERDGRLDRPGAVERQRDRPPLRRSGPGRRARRRGHPEDDRRNLPHQGEQPGGGGGDLEPRLRASTPSVRS